MYFSHGTPNAIDHPSEWTRHICYKISQCDDINPIAATVLVGLDPTLHGHAQTELDDVTCTLFDKYNHAFNDHDRSTCFLQFCHRFEAFVRVCGGGLMTYIYACTEKWGQCLFTAIMGTQQDLNITIMGANCSLAPCTNVESEKKEIWQSYTQFVRPCLSTCKAATITGLDKHVHLLNLDKILTSGLISLYSLCCLPMAHSGKITLYAKNHFATQHAFLALVSDHIYIAPKSISIHKCIQHAFLSQTSTLLNVNLDTVHHSLRNINGWFGLQPQELISYAGKVHLMWENRGEPVNALVGIWPSDEEAEPFYKFMNH
eukprot:6328468-Ditylum_brightwellii.AAC.1